MTQVDVYLNEPAGCSKTSDHFGLVQRTSMVLCILHAGVDDDKTLGPCTCDRSAWYLLDEQVACEKSKKKHCNLHKNKVFTVSRRVRFELHLGTLACSSGCETLTMKGDMLQDNISEGSLEREPALGCVCDRRFRALEES
jgi:hypothetical protein